jgi:hypothetical protein
MSARRVVLLVTCLVVAGLAGWFAVARWEQASRVATVVSALAAVAAVGVAVWAALPGADRRMVRVSNTGPATAGLGGTATSGLTGPAAGLRGTVEVDRTGHADASGGGNATTGADLS